MMNWRSNLRAWAALRGDVRGVAALEFALVVPMVIVVYAGGFEIAQAATVDRKLTDTTVQLANVTSQYTIVAKSDIANIMAASQQIMAPYPTTPLRTVVSEVSTDKNSAGSVVWCQASSGACISGTVAMPASFASPNAYYILVQTTYNYTPTIGAAFVSSIPMTDQIFMVPRQSTNIPCTDCPPP